VLARYRLLTTWQVHAPAGDVWDVLEDAAAWPDWWPGLRSVREVEPGEPDGLGQVARLEWRARLPYSVVFDVRATRKERPHVLEGHASGDLAGSGRFEITEAGGGLTTVTYAWDVQTTKTWMRRTALLLRPVFVWNHDVVMRAGGRGLAQRLAAPRPAPARP
jgi:carbon monoxide dehydrogenase subunit G